MIQLFCVNWSIKDKQNPSLLFIAYLFLFVTFSRINPDMLELRLNCENWNIPFPPNCEDAIINTYGYTFRKTSMDGLLGNLCPNCIGGFEERPIRPKEQFKELPPLAKSVYQTEDFDGFREKKEKDRQIPLKQR